jgi:CheY-like chemotaxis protein
MAVAATSILVVDDERETFTSLSDILSDLGYIVDTANDGPAALELSAGRGSW